MVLSTLVAPQLLRRLTGRVSAGRVDAGYVDRTVLTTIAVTLTDALISRFAQKYARTLGESVSTELRERVMNRVVHLPLSAVKSAGIGDLVGCTTTGVSHTEFLVRVGVPQVLVCMMTIIFMLLAAAVANSLLVLGLLAIAPSAWSMIHWYLPTSIPAYRVGSATQTRLNGAVPETVEHAETVDVLGIRACHKRATMAPIKEVWSLERYTIALRVYPFMMFNVTWWAPVVAVLL